MAADPRAKPHNDHGVFIPLRLANDIRPHVAKWRTAGYPGVTGITKALLTHWYDQGPRNFPLFFCQLEAIETLIWWVETAPAARADIHIPGDGGEFSRLCCKLATGTGKTVVMAMLIAWQGINRATNPRDQRFSQHFFIVAPNLTVRERLAVLVPGRAGNYYEEFDIVPQPLRERLRQARVWVRNWHALSWENEEQIAKKKTVDKRGPLSDAAYTREVLGELAGARSLVVINDEAHHAWRVPAEGAGDGVLMGAVEEATRWIDGLDRIHRVQGIAHCFDFSATPFVPGGKKNSEETLFDWIVSDFGLNDAIESGLVKTPRLVASDDALPDAKTYKPRLYHIYGDHEVQADLSRRAKPHEPLPPLVTAAYNLLGADWEKTKNEWAERETPPVMITVVNGTHTAARIKHAFDNKEFMIKPLCAPQGILHIDSNVLKKAEAKESGFHETAAGEEANDTAPKATQKGIAEALREQVNTVGRMGQPGEKIQNVISVGMLSEGWDARTVTHIMGLRAFTSQLLCEQVVGRGLRRASYEINPKTKRFDAEYVNVFGVPFRFLPHEEGGGGAPPPSNKLTVCPVKENAEFALSWPNVLRIDRTLGATLSVDWARVDALELDVAQIPTLAEIAPAVDGKPDVSRLTDIDLAKLLENEREQTLVFKAACATWQEIKDRNPKWRISQASLVAQLIVLADEMMAADCITIIPKIFSVDEKKRRLVIALNLSKVIRHFLEALTCHNTEHIELVLDGDHPFRGTGDMTPWRTGKPCAATRRSHINYCVYDSTWESSAAYRLDTNDRVAAWAKNDHLGFHIHYVHGGVVHVYRPDFIVALAGDERIVMEVKGQQTDADDSKHRAMREWADAVNRGGSHGRWRFAVARTPGAVEDILAGGA